MYKVISVMILALCGAYILSVKNVSLNITNSFLPDIFRRQTVIIQNTPRPEQTRIYATHSETYNRKGQLKIKSNKHVTVYLIEESSHKKIGPLEVKPRKDFNIEIEKGNYKAVVLEGNEKYATDLRFLGSTGTLEL